MSIIINLDIMLARRKMRLKKLSEKIGISVQNLSILKAGKIKSIRLSTLNHICQILECQPGDILEYRKSIRSSEIPNDNLTDNKKYIKL